MKEEERGRFSPKLRLRIKDKNSSPHDTFHRFLFPFSSKLRLVCSRSTRLPVSSPRGSDVACWPGHQAKTNTNLIKVVNGHVPLLKVFVDRFTFCGFGGSCRTLVGKE